MNSSAQSMPPNDAPESKRTFKPPRISPNAAEALLAFTLMERYQQVAGCLKVLRADRLDMERPGGCSLLTVEGREALRGTATGLFNHLYRLVQSRLLTPEGFVLVLEPRAAQLWLDNVAPLDAAVRRHAAKLEGRAEAYALGEHPIEIFYRRYAETGNLLLQVPKDADPNTH